MKTLREIRDALATWQATAVLLLLYAVALAAATLLESGLGAEAARSVVYHAWWMYVLYGLMIANFILIGRRMRLLKRRMWGVLMLHGGLMVIILGALITHIWGYEGTLHLREGETSDRIRVSHTDRRTIPFRVTLRSFHLLRYPGSHTPSSYESEVTIHDRRGSREVRIFMNHIARVDGFRLYQSSYDPDEQGTILSVNYDPVGTPVTYVGYFLLIAGLVTAVGRKDSRLRKLFSQLDARPPVSQPEERVHESRL